MRGLDANHTVLDEFKMYVVYCISADLKNTGRTLTPEGRGYAVSCYGDTRYYVTALHCLLQTCYTLVPYVNTMAT